MTLFKFKPNAKAEIGSEDPLYALTFGGYLKPEGLLEDKELALEVKKAARLVQDFIQACQDNEIIEEC